MKKLIVLVLLFIILLGIIFGYFYIENLKEQKVIEVAKSYYTYWLEGNKDEIKKIVTYEIQDDELHSELYKAIYEEFIKLDDYYEALDVVKIDDFYIIKSKFKYPNCASIIIENISEPNGESNSSILSIEDYYPSIDTVKESVKEKIKNNTLECTEIETNIKVVNENGKFKISNIEYIEAK